MPGLILAKSNTSMTQKSYLPIAALLIFLVSCSQDPINETPPKPDTKGPEVVFSIKGVDPNSNGTIIVNGEIEININANDDGGIGKVEAFIDNEKVGEDLTTPYVLAIDLSKIAPLSGENTSNSNRILKITVTDKTGNQTSLEQAILIATQTPLITINFPEGFLNFFFQNFHVFASRMNGQLLEGTTVAISTSTRAATISTTEEINADEEFMITLMTFNPSSERSFSFGSTYQNLTIENPKEINLKLPDRLLVLEDKTFPAHGIDESTPTSGQGSDYRADVKYKESEWSIQTLEPLGQPEKITDKVLIWNFEGGDFTNYKYMLIERPIPENFELNLADFVNDNSDSGTISFTNYPQIPEIKTNLTILGYESQEDFDNDAYHQVWGQGTGNFLFPITYGYYNAFPKYRYSLTMQNFHVEDEGLPNAEYTIPDWKLEPVIENNTVILNKTGTGHTIGRVALREDASNYTYDWRIIFNSEKTDTIIIPELPEVFGNTPLSKNITSNSLSIQQVELSQFENIPTYENYLSEIVKENRDFRKVSEHKEVIFKSYVPVYFEIKDLFFN